MTIDKNRIIKIEVDVQPTENVPIVAPSDKPKNDKDFIENNKIGKIKIEKNKNSRNKRKRNN